MRMDCTPQTAESCAHCTTEGQGRPNPSPGPPAHAHAMQMVDLSRKRLGTPCVDSIQFYWGSYRFPKYTDAVK
jgi:hypothetical protein